MQYLSILHGLILHALILQSDLSHVMLRTELFPYSNVTERSHPNVDEFRDQLTMYGKSLACN